MAVKKLSPEARKIMREADSAESMAHNREEWIPTWEGMLKGVENELASLRAGTLESELEARAELYRRNIAQLRASADQYRHQADRLRKLFA